MKDETRARGSVESVEQKEYDEKRRLFWERVLLNDLKEHIFAKGYGLEVLDVALVEGSTEKAAYIYYKSPGDDDTPVDALRDYITSHTRWQKVRLARRSSKKNEGTS